MRYSVSILVLVAAGLALAHAQTAPTGYEWRTFADDADQIALWQGGRQLGNYRLSAGAFFRHHAGGGFDEQPSEPPAPPPAWAIRKKCGCSKQCKCLAKKCACTPQTRCDAHCDCQKVIGGAGYLEPDGTPNYGVEEKKIPAQPKHVVNGHEVTKAELLEAIGAPALPDDAKWLSVTAIGPQAMLDQFTRDFASAPELAAWKGKVKPKTYLPTHWAVAGLGYVQPALYIQDWTGKVLWREDSYPGAAALAEDLRKADPNYDPSRDPPRKPKPAPDAPDSPDDASGLGAGHLLAALGAGVGGIGCFASFVFMVLLLLVLLWRRARAGAQPVE